MKDESRAERLRTILGISGNLRTELINAKNAK